MKTYYHGPYFIITGEKTVQVGVTDAGGRDHLRYNAVPIADLAFPNLRDSEGMIDPSREICRRAMKLAGIM